jgi:hypothetical protein
MTTSPQSPQPVAVGAAPAGVPVRYARQPLGLPAGSVRALLTIIVLGLIWTLMVLPEDRVKGIPLYLFYLMFLVLGHFFAAHGHSIAGPSTGPASPLHLPRGSLRTLVILGFLGVLGWRYYQHPDWQEIFRLQQPIVDQPYLPLVLVGAFFLGVFLSRGIGQLFRGPEGESPWLQDLRAWLALLATVGLAIEVIIQLVINPSLPPERQLSLPTWQMILAAIVSFYFGARS